MCVIVSVLDVLDSLVASRWSPLAATGSINAVGDCHARYFADQAIASCEMWDGPDNASQLAGGRRVRQLRAAFRWAADRGDPVGSGGSRPCQEPRHRRSPPKRAD